MNLVDIESLDKQLDFEPLKPWPKSMPCFALNGQLVCGFDRTSGQAIELNEPLAEIFTQLHPQLKLSELSRAFQCLRPHLTPEQMSGLMKHYGIKNSRRAEKFFSLFENMIGEFRNWCDEKNPGINDLAVLFCFEDLKPLESVMQKVAGEQMSKSQGTLALEICGELILSGQNDAVETSLSVTPTASWISALKRLRYPITTEKVEDRKKRLNNIPWPRGTSAQLVRHGDRDSVELKIRTSSAVELSQQLEALQSLSEKQSGDWL